MSGLICFLREEPHRGRWRIATTSRPVLDFARAESRRLSATLYPAHTPMYGGHTDVARLEAYLTNYDLGDGWFGSLSDEQMSSLVTRIRKETAFLDGEPLP